MNLEISGVCDELASMDVASIAPLGDPKMALVLQIFIRNIKIYNPIIRILYPRFLK